MYLKELIAQLEAVDDKTKTVKLGFSRPHSYRGYYEDLAFAPTEYVTIQAMLNDAKSALGQTFFGWKGGEFAMSEYSRVWLAERGDTGETLGKHLLGYMLKDTI